KFLARCQAVGSWHSRHHRHLLSEASVSFVFSRVSRPKRLARMLPYLSASAAFGIGRTGGVFKQTELEHAANHDTRRRHDGAPRPRGRLVKAWVIEAEHA